MEYRPYFSEDDSESPDIFEHDSDTDDSNDSGSSKKRKSSRQRDGSARKAADQQKRWLFEMPKDKDNQDRKDEVGRLPEKSEQTPEVDAPPTNPEEISITEMSEITRQIIVARNNELRQELSGTRPESSEEAEILGNAMFIEALSEHIDETDLPDDSLLDEIAEGVIRDLEIRSPNTEDPDEGSAGEFSELSDIDDDDEGAALSAASSVVAPVQSTGSGSGHYGGGAIAPPPRAVGGSPPSSPAVPSTAKESHGPEALMTYSADRHRRRADLLVGGIVGYLIGRRRGRIKTEDRLLPVQESLERQVRGMHDKISEREREIRSLVSEKVAREGKVAQQKVADKVETRARSRQETKYVQDKKRLDEKTETKQKHISEDVPQAAERLEEQPVYDQQPSVAERQLPRLTEELLATPEFVPARPVAIEHPLAQNAAKDVVNKMPDVELLVVAARVESGGKTAKQLYESGYISKKDLREVVYEHVRGSGHAERLLADRLKPVPESESIERMAQRGISTSTVSGGLTGGSVPILANDTQNLHSNGSERTDALSKADAILAQHASKDRDARSHSSVWIVLVVLIASLAFAFFLF